MKPTKKKNEFDKKFYIKWMVIAMTAIWAAIAAVWLSMHNWDTEESMKALAQAFTEQPAETEEQAPAEQEGSAVKEEQAAPEEKTEQPETPAEEQPKEETPAPAPKDATVYPDIDQLPAEPTIINGILLANKQHPLPASYAPGENAKARAAFDAMAQAAAEDGLQLVAFSTYRGFDRQKQLYEGYVAKDGQAAADRYSARPGFSEHQTGLAFDIGEAGQEQHWASSSFGDTAGGKWVKENAHNYGFILRYPQGKEQITGYMHESWHFRYVGKEAATAIYNQNITLEEYLGI
ncbi:M15 family metallopeptidase [Planococcus maitriensis]|uniref:D-alanyl-D-alanine carboxypeptidase n=1 Tax=Planococcus maitriensis TaxID=221799 RepID=A0A365K5R2_9BACL|nr:M15 family metallopeptidase [Planococcus maitriensis]RAZ67955.1 D-alanyl-D-alanine carboxypeptidase [Planococcus maitriensis]